MVLEATMIVVDNSESSRNGDYPPTRFGAQADAVNLIYNAKTNANPESSVGLMSMGGTGPEVLTTLTTDRGKILDGIHRTKIKGTSHFSTGINIAALALKHRGNKSQRQRIIVFSCSPIQEDAKMLIKLAKRLKKINVSVDIISFGQPSDEDKKKLTDFNEAVKNSEGSYLGIIDPSANLLSDTLLSTELLAGDGVGIASGGGAGGASGGDAAMAENQFEFGVNPEVDPELALALRMSYEEEKARQEKERKAQEDADKEKLQGIPEGDESQPLLGEGGEAAGAGEGSSHDAAAGSKKKDDEHKMDTA